ncbi:heme acquisition protein HasA [Pseudomonas sp. NPDC007930]|uniref:heme acquisition protein HasA n=1 Tax=Pseudomonas sp. NPDC007930 TaxID=3364417 RepID=UPI0036EBB531
MATLSTTTAYSAYTLTDLVEAWAYNFGTAAHGAGNTGGFNTGYLAGTQYASSSATSYGFIAESDTGLSYNILSHVVTGNLDSLAFGEDLNGTNLNTSSGNYTLTDVTFSITDLGWDSSTTNAALADLLTLDADNGDVLSQLSDLLAGLEDSFASAIASYNSTYGASETFETITVAELAQVGAAELATVGVAAFSESDLALAA